MDVRWLNRSQADGASPLIVSPERETNIQGLSLQHRSDKKT